MNEENKEINDYEFTLESKLSVVEICYLFCGTSPKPPCFGEYPNCILHYREIDENG